MNARAVEEVPRIQEADYGRLLELVRGADSVELKMTVPASDHRRTIGLLPLDPVEAQPRQVWFFDTPDLALDRAGVVVRARRIAGGRGDTVVKLRPVVPAELPAELRHEAAFNVEVDAMPGGFVCSGSYKGRSTGQEIREVVNGTLALRKIFTKEQRRFFRDHAPAEIALDALVPLGPTFILKATFQPPELGRRFVDRGLVLPGRLADPRAVDEVPPGRDVPGRGGSSRLPGQSGHPRDRCPGDEDPGGAELLQVTARSAGGRGMTGARRRTVRR